MARPEEVIVQRVVQALETIDGATPYQTDLSDRVWLFDPETIAQQADTPFVTVGFQAIDPAQTDGARSITIAVEGVVGPDYWTAAGIAPVVAALRLQGDVQQCLGVQHRDLVVAADQMSPLYRGANSTFVGTTFMRFDSGSGGRMGFVLRWRYVFHEAGVNGP